MPPIINTTNHIVDYCEDINPTDIYIYELGETRYLRSESTYFTYNFGYNYQGAEESLEAIKKYGFDQFCTVGGLMKHSVPFPPMTGDDGILRH